MLARVQGGSQAIVAALLRGLGKHGGHLMLRSPVELIQPAPDSSQSAAAVQLASGRALYVREGVVSNASVWDTANLLGSCDQLDDFDEYRGALEMNDSMVHLHVGFRRKAGAHHLMPSAQACACHARTAGTL